MNNDEEPMTAAEFDAHFVGHVWEEAGPPVVLPEGVRGVCGCGDPGQCEMAGPDIIHAAPREQALRIAGDRFGRVPGPGL